MNETEDTTGEISDDIIVINSKPRLGERIKNFFANPKKRMVFIICAGLVLIAAVGYGVYAMTKPSPLDTNITGAKSVTKPAAEETKYPSALTGELTDQESASRHPLGVMIENHIDARPQAGLSKADVVYEAIAEGGITRFLALFSSHQADLVGPVRSARTYFVNWAEGYSAYLAHVGGNYDALEQIAADRVLDLDQFKYSSPYWRDKSLAVSSEHTMFSSTIKLRQQSTALGYTTDNKFKVYKFKDKCVTPKIPGGEATPCIDNIQGTATANDINVNFSSANYDVSFQWDGASRTYKRSIAGKVQLDRESKAEIAPTNLIVMIVNRTPTLTKINEQGWIMDNIGSGTAKIFIDGKEIDAKWQKTSKGEREVFYDSSNTEITFNRGQFWICVISPELTVTYK